jgi:3-hydroxyisobutyrate dehydrogenase-like beta-hydroxyacid dehydrogenase
MGAGMVANLKAAGHELTLYNRSKEKAAALAADGIQIADSPAEAARSAEAIFTMLSDDHAVSEVVFGENGIADALRGGALHVSSSTISTALSRRLAEEHARRQQHFVSAPVFGRPEAAAGKKLIVTLAGSEEALKTAVPLADSIGRRSFVVGPEPWMANAVKLSGNFLIGSMLEALAEAFSLVEKSGVERQNFLEIMNELFGSPVYANYGKNIVDRKFDPPGFALKLGLKDIKLVLELSDEVMTAMPFASVVRDNLLSAMAHGQESMDWSSLSLVADRRAHLSTS